MKLATAMKYYTETRGTLVKKYRNLFGQYIFVLSENGKKTKICVGICNGLEATAAVKRSAGRKEDLSKVNFFAKAKTVAVRRLFSFGYHFNSTGIQTS